MNPDVPFVAVRETHIGVVFLIGDLAYKLKKPVRTPFLDFSTRQRRLRACQREVELCCGASAEPSWTTNWSPSSGAGR